MTGDAPAASRGLRGRAVLADPLVRELLAARLVAVLSTHEPDGAIHAVPMWFGLDGDAIVLATASGSRKVRNLERDPRATVTVHDSRGGFEICGTAIAGRVGIVRGVEARPLVTLVHERYLLPEAERPRSSSAFLASDDAALRLSPERAWTWDERGASATRELALAGAALPLEPTSSRFD